MNTIHFYFIAGSSGGHIVPSITLAEQYRAHYPHASFTFITTARDLDARILSDYPWITQIHKITQPKFPGTRFWKYPSFLARLIKGVQQCWKIIHNNNETHLISMGGNISFPACIVAWLKGIPIDLFELNAIPGKAIRITTFFARRIFICFPEAQERLASNKCILTSYPIRFQPAHQAFDFGERPYKTILILGGSQGSSFINSMMQQWLEKNKLSLSQFTFIHQTGSAHLQQLREFYQTHQIQAHVFDYCKNLDEYYKKADLVICRSGAGTLFETLFFQKKCITIPLESCADNHQFENASAITRRYPDLFTLVRQSDLQKDPELLDYAIHMTLYADGQESGFVPSPKT